MEMDTLFPGSSSEMHSWFPHSVTMAHAGTLQKAVLPLCLSPHPKPQYCDSKLVHVSVQPLSPGMAQHPKSVAGSLIPFLVTVQAVTYS